MFRIYELSLLSLKYTIVLVLWHKFPKYKPNYFASLTKMIQRESSRKKVACFVFFPIIPHGFWISKWGYSNQFHYRWNFFFFPPRQVDGIFLKVIWKCKARGAINIFFQIGFLDSTGSLLPVSLQYFQLLLQVLSSWSENVQDPYFHRDFNS